MRTVRPAVVDPAVEPGNQQHGPLVHGPPRAADAYRSGEFDVVRFAGQDEARHGQIVPDPLDDGVRHGVVVGNRVIRIPEAVDGSRDQELGPRSLHSHGTRRVGADGRDRLRGDGVHSEEFFERPSLHADGIRHCGPGDAQIADRRRSDPQQEIGVRSRVVGIQPGRRSRREARVPLREDVGQERRPCPARAFRRGSVHVDPRQGADPGWRSRRGRRSEASGLPVEPYRGDVGPSLPGVDLDGRVECFGCIGHGRLFPLVPSESSRRRRIRFPIDSLDSMTD